MWPGGNAGAWAGKAGAGCLAILSCALLLSLGTVEHIPASVPAFLLVLAALTFWRPDLGLLALAALLPIANWIGRIWNYQIAWAETLTVAIAAGWFARVAVRGRSGHRDLDVPAQLFSIVVVSSLLVYLAVLGWRLTGNALAPPLGSMLDTYFAVRGGGDPFDAAMRLLESMVLLIAAAGASNASADFPRRLARAVACGAALAGALNLWRLWEGARRTAAPLAMFVQYLATIRENIHYADLNAAGSYFVLALFVAAGLAARPQHRRWLAAVLVIAAALWVTGSRAALIAGIAAALLPLMALLPARALRRREIVGGGAVLLIAMLVGVAHYLPMRGNQHSSLDAVRVRWELARTSVRMTAAQPVFGVGVGQFYQLSGEFSSPALLTLFPPARNENAHNNFLQILAELGVVGFALYAWLLAAGASRISQTVRDGHSNPIAWGMACGVAAFLLTCLAGHPLLIDEPAFTFWVVFGGAAGAARRPDAAPRIRPSRLVAGAALVMLVVIPVRARAAIASANMEHAGFGLSVWQREIDGVRYRRAGVTSSVFLPGYARSVSIPLRAIGSAPLHVRLTLDGHPADIVTVPADRWFNLRFQIPGTRVVTTYRRLDLDVVEQNAGSADELMIGKVEPY